MIDLRRNFTGVVGIDLEGRFNVFEAPGHHSGERVEITGGGFVSHRQAGRASASHETVWRSVVSQHDSKLKNTVNG